jgi:PAS domain S-box-containing protein
MFNNRYKLPLIFGTVAAVTFAAGMAVYLMGVYVARANRASLRSEEVLNTVDETRFLLTEVEADHRSYLVTGQQHYLDDYHDDLQNVVPKLQALAQWAQQGEVSADQVNLLMQHTHAALADLSNTISLRTTQGPEAALAFISTDHDEQLFDNLRDQCTVLRHVVQQEHVLRRQARDLASEIRTPVDILAGLVSLAFIIWAYREIRRTVAALEEQRRLLQASEESLRLYRNVLEAAANAVIIADSSGTIEWVNPAFTRLTGYSAAEAVGQNPRLLNSGHLPPEFFRSLWETILTGRFWQGEIINRRKNGEIYHEAMTITPVRDPATQRVTHFIAIKEDITGRKRMEQELRQRAEELKRSNEDLEQFAYVVSHDLQEPLRMVTQFLRLLNERYPDRLDQDGRDFIHFAVDGAERMSRLITDLLQFSRIGTQGKKLEPVALAEVLKKAKENLGVAIAEASADVSAGPLPIVRGDPVQLVQLFQNLIGNAIKFRAPDRPATVCVGAEHADGQWRISVTDRGIGIAPEYTETVFQVFKRLHTREEYPGTGIGLAVCKKIVERHGGRIWVESEPGKGSAFHFTLPPA